MAIVVTVTVLATGTNPSRPSSHSLTALAARITIGVVLAVSRSRDLPDASALDRDRRGQAAVVEAKLWWQELTDDEDHNDEDHNDDDLGRRGVFPAAR